VGETISKLRATMSKPLSAIQASIQTHKWWWAGGGGAAVAAIAAVVIVFGGFLGPSGKAICTAALEHARDYGVVPNTAALANMDAARTDVRNRRLCTAQAGGNKYNLTVDIACKDVKKKDCVALYSVARDDGLSTYQVRQVPDDDQDAVVPADAGNAGGGEAQSAGSAGNDSDIQPATGTHGGDASQQQPDAGTPPQ
jgi:hypothetical protein